MLCPNHMNVLQEDKLKPTWCKSIRVFCFILIKYFFFKEIVWYYFSLIFQSNCTTAYNPNHFRDDFNFFAGFTNLYTVVSWNENRKMAPECKNMQTHWTWLVYLIENMRFRGKIADIGCIQHFTSKIYIFLSLNLSTVE